MRAYVEGADDPEAELEDKEIRLPAMAVGDRLAVNELEARGHTTQPPARYTEASLVKALEDLGVGRPSTYASIIGTIQDRGYVWKKGSALVPSFIAFAVINLLEQYFATLVDYGFTASMEDDLDEIAKGAEEAVPYLQKFYFGNGTAGLKEMVSAHLGEIDAKEINSIRIADGIMVRVGRYGPYVQKGDERGSVPEDLAPDELTADRVDALLQAGSSDRELGTDPGTGLAVVVKAGRFGPYVQLGEAVAGNGKPKTASLVSGMDPATVTLDDALRLLTIPRLVGKDPADGQEIVATNGRYGPYLKKGNDSRSLANEELLFTVSLDEALALFAQPKQRRGQGSAAAVRELGPDPASGQPIALREGRFGPYVTDGETNASLRKGDSMDTITAERAAELLADRRAAGPPARRARKAPAKKAAGAKSAPKKTATKKAAGAKAAAKKVAAKRVAATKAGARERV
jgi:DNA topoisomerase-1